MEESVPGHHKASASYFSPKHNDGLCQSGGSRLAVPPIPVTVGCVTETDMGVTLLETEIVEWLPERPFNLRELMKEVPLAFS